jgi:hypothetical protein
MGEYKCNKCQKIFTRNGDLKRHENSENKCDEKYSDIINIKDISTFYNSLNKNECMYCKKTYKTKRLVVKHIRNNCKCIVDQKRNNNIFNEKTELGEIKLEIQNLNSQLSEIKKLLEIESKK